MCAATPLGLAPWRAAASSDESRPVRHAQASAEGPEGADRRGRPRRRSARSATTPSAWRRSPSRVGISATALYRHYPSKYDLFRDAVLALGEQLVDCTAFADEAPPDAGDAAATVSALTDTALANRESGGLYRWEARYLRGDDQATLNGQMRTVNRRIQRPLMALRPELTSRQRWMLSSSMLSVIGSIVDHRAKLPAVHIRAVLAEIAAAISTADVPELAGRVRRAVPAAASRGRSVQIRSAADGVGAAVQPEGLPRHHDGGDRVGGRHADVGDLPVLLR